MWLVSGVDKITLKRVRICIADNVAELRMILRQERKNYFDMAFERAA